MLGLLYPKLANVAAEQQQVTGRFNGWACDLLMLHFEELQNDNYRNKEFETFIKQFTTPTGSGERKFKENGGDEKHNAILGFNTNQPDLYGVIRGDEALISRLALLHFKPKPDNLDWDEVKKDLLVNDDTNLNNIGFTLYTDLKNNYKIPDRFKTSRYYSEDKNKLIEQLRGENKKNYRKLDLWVAT
jgi:hypothetical protein